MKVMPLRRAAPVSDNSASALAHVAARRHLSRRQREAVTGFLWIAPWLIGFVVFPAGPMLFSLGTSFTRFTLGKTAQFAGLENYVRAFTSDPLFWPSLGRTL